MIKKIVRTAQAAFKRPRGPASPLSEESRRKIARGVVGKTATGNVNLQRGEYMSRKDVEERFEEIRCHNFDNS